MGEKKLVGACDICHRRKIKCDISVTGPPCTRCKELNVGPQCTLHKRKKKTDRLTNLSIHDHYMSAVSVSPKRFMKATSNSRGPRVNMVFYPTVSETASKFYKNVVGYEPQLSDVDLMYLTQLGCFSLPGTDVCWKYLNYYFLYINKFGLVVDQSNFVKKYQKLPEGPSIVLLQSMLCMGSILKKSLVETEQEREQEHRYIGIFYKRTRALLAVSVEQDPVALVQTYMTLACIAEMTEHAMDTNSRYWVQKAHQVAMNAEFYRDHPESDEYERNIYRRLWWAIYIRDRMYVFWYGGPFLVSKSDTKITKDCEELFVLDRINNESQHFFRNMISIAELIDITLSKSRSSNGKIYLLRDIQQYDMLVTKWFERLPPTFVFKLDKPSSQRSEAATITVFYYLLLLTLHRMDLQREYRSLGPDQRERYDIQNHPSWGMSFHCAFMISQILNVWMKSLDHAPCSEAYLHCILSSSFIMLCQLQNTDPQISRFADDCVRTNLSLLEMYNKYHLQGRMAHYLITQIYHDKAKQTKMLKSLLDVDKEPTTGLARLQNEITSSLEQRLENRLFESSDDQIKKDTAAIREFRPFQALSQNYSDFMKDPTYSNTNPADPIIDPQSKSAHNPPPPLTRETSKELVTDWLARISNQDSSDLKDLEFFKYLGYPSDPPSTGSKNFQTSDSDTRTSFSNSNTNYLPDAENLPDFDELLQSL
ncbi:hypothetical protein OGAPHI_003196 [Ogataea philodendri]|uniref:Zn(2)-C6 fungal-type domain-containing protein n=1 Tax=Ogataea philodendri TaxID=1378263 RepID=A0A9P8P8G2_9ASCO|nr:uncharacterized protein OGAPHI_003196 [Ogataea philodendri]KAH3666747.1 hypothetical protein OGAPHI_003196 [Ogataea philodendri]